MKVLADKKARAFASDEMVINAPVEKVYQVLSDIKNWPSWQSDIKNTYIDGEPEEGKTFLWTSGSMKIQSKLHTVTRPSEFGWTGKIWWISAIHNWEFRQSEKSTKVIVSESMKGLGAGMMKKSLKNGMKKNLLELRKEAEK